MKGFINVNKSSFFNAMKSTVNDYLPKGVHIVEIMEVSRKKHRDDNEQKKTRGYVDDTEQITVWLENSEGRTAYHLNLGGFLHYDALIKNVDHWLNQVDPKQIGLTETKWKKLSVAQKMEKAFSKSGKFAVYNMVDEDGNPAPIRIQSESNTTVAQRIFSRFLGAVKGAGYALPEGLDLDEYVEILDRDLKGCKIEVTMVSDDDGNTIVDPNRIKSVK